MKSYSIISIHLCTDILNLRGSSQQAIEYAIQQDSNSPIPPLPKRRPLFVEEAGGGGSIRVQLAICNRITGFMKYSLWSCDAVGARLWRILYGMISIRVLYMFFLWTVFLPLNLRVCTMHLDWSFEVSWGVSGVSLILICLFCLLFAKD